MSLFGRSLRPADTVASAAWLDRACAGAPWTVGALVPNHYEGLLRVRAPAPREDWWPAYRELFEIVASVGERHTSSPDRAWFAVWEGHGFDQVSRRIAWRDAPADDAERRWRAAERERLHEEDLVRNEAVRWELQRMPRFDRPGRAYYLLTGPVRAVTEMRYPDAEDWRHPDLFWPDDRQWFVATDVDFWSLYVGGPRRFLSELADAVPTPCASVQLDDPLEAED